MYLQLLKITAPLINLLYKLNTTLYVRFYFTIKYIFEADRFNFIKRWVKDGFVVVDVGANVGSYTVAFAGSVGKRGKVFAFEPDATNFKILRKVTNKFPNVTPVEKAVGSRNEVLKLYLSKLHNTDHHTYDIGENREIMKIRSVSLDSYFKSRFQINLLKIDVQGYDYFVLLGAQKLLKKSTKVALMGEIWPYALNKAGVNPYKYVELIKKLGFKFVKLKHVQKKLLTKHLNDPAFYVDFIAIKS